MPTFELSQTRSDGSLSSVTFVKAETLAEAQEIVAPCFCTGTKVLTETTPEEELSPFEEFIQTLDEAERVYAEQHAVHEQLSMFDE